MLGLRGQANRVACRSRTSKQAARVIPHAFLTRLGSVLAGLRPTGANMPLATDKWWDGNTVAVVTGGNKGIGFEAARMLAEQGLTTVVTARNEELGKQAAAKIQEAAPDSRVLFHQLDISDPASIDRFVTWLREQLGGLTILINNAGFAYKGSIFGADEAQVTLGTNYFGTRELTEKLIPLLRGPSRIVNVSSRAGSRSIVKSSALLSRLTSATSPQQLDSLAGEFVGAIRVGDYKDKGWPESMYGISKLLLSLWTAQLAEQLKGEKVMVNAMCPGWCRTDMSSQVSEGSAWRLLSIFNTSNYARHQERGGGCRHGGVAGASQPAGFHVRRILGRAQQHPLVRPRRRAGVGSRCGSRMPYGVQEGMERNGRPSLPRPPRAGLSWSGQRVWKEACCTSGLRSQVPENGQEVCAMTLQRG
ncbi:hypothetical protein Agub_g8358 [Astrephomene gubernaculifera]|uniref:Uncharacterized protein n=1 Tax=Astrephomene gubernaculifera TaxID=47775 RepID=A0AAD3DRJ0_9CHLO|nr:hypothetical protein Agub_g8358 [Astrephomene gubernaculifera]